MRRRYFYSLLLILSIACKPQKKEQSNTPTIVSKPDSIIQNKPDNSSKEYVKGELLVVFKNEKSYQKTIKDLEKNNGVQLISMLMVAPNAIIGHFKVPVGKEKEMISLFQKHTEVKYAEVNALGKFNSLSNHK